MKNKNNQKGFSSVYAILIIVIVGIIGFTGWYVYNATQNNNKTLSNLNDSTVLPKSSETNTVTFDKNLSNYSSRKLIGSNDKFEVYLVDTFEENAGASITGNILVYSKSAGKAMPYNIQLNVLKDGTTLQRQDDNYLIIDTGTSPVRSKTVISLNEKIAVHLQVLGDLLYYKDHYIYTFLDKKYENRAHGTGEALSIGVYNMLTRVQSTLIAADSLKDINAKLINGNTLNYDEWVYSDSNSIGIGKYTTVTKKYDLNKLD